MKKFNDNEQIIVYSDSLNNLYITTQFNPNGYELTAVSDYNNPPFISLNYSEIRVLNNSSNAVRVGKVRFDKEVEADIYESLGITDWKEILTLQEIEDIVKSPTHSADVYEKLRDIKDRDYFERIRSIAVALKNTDSYDISARLLNFIEQRFEEFSKGVVNSTIKIKQNTSTQPANTVSQDEFNTLKAQNEQLMNQFQLLMAQLQNQNAPTQVIETATPKVAETSKEPAPQEQKKTAGRPPKTK